jgi:hypothetical protein
LRLLVENVVDADFGPFLNPGIGSLDAGSAEIAGLCHAAASASPMITASRLVRIMARSPPFSRSAVYTETFGSSIPETDGSLRDGHEMFNEF